MIWRGSSISAFRTSNRTGDGVALAETELPNLVGRHIDVVLAGDVSGHSQKAVALGKDVEKTLAQFEITLRDLLLVTTTTVAPTLTLTTLAVTLPALALAITLVLTATVSGCSCGRRLVGCGPLRARSRLGKVDHLGGGVIDDLTGVHESRDQFRLLKPVGLEFGCLGNLPQFVYRLAL